MSYRDGTEFVSYGSHRPLSSRQSRLEPLVVCLPNDDGGLVSALGLSQVRIATRDGVVLIGVRIRLRWDGHDPVAGNTTRRDQLIITSIDVVEGGPPIEAVLEYRDIVAHSGKDGA